MNKKQNSFSANKAGVVFSCLIVAIFIGLCFYKTDSLIIRDRFTHEVKLARVLSKDSYIGIIYTHSVMKTETSEWYRTDKGKLILMEQRYHSQGAGLPSTTDYKFKYENNIFTLYDINKPFDEITYRTGAVIANHRLSIAGKEKPFLSFSDPREALSFKVEQTSIIKLLIWRCMYG